MKKLLPKQVKVPAQNGRWGVLVNNPGLKNSPNSIILKNEGSLVE